MKNGRYLMLMILLLTVVLSACGTEPAVSETQAAQATAVYKVTVLTKAGEPVKDVLVQLCSDICVPGMTDEKGVAEFELPADDYKVSILSTPEGYTHSGEEEEFFFETGSRDVTIRLQTVD